MPFEIALAGFCLFSLGAVQMLSSLSMHEGHAPKRFRIFVGIVLAVLMVLYSSVFVYVIHIYDPDSLFKGFIIGVLLLLPSIFSLTIRTKTFFWIQGFFVMVVVFPFLGWSVLNVLAAVSFLLGLFFLGWGQTTTRSSRFRRYRFSIGWSFLLVSLCGAVLVIFLLPVSEAFKIVYS